jgi:hypothetical protein
LNNKLTESQVIAVAINQFVLDGIDRRIKDVLVQESRRLTTLKGIGWKVFFIFENEDQFLNKSVTYEVNEERSVTLFENM